MTIDMRHTETDPPAFAESLRDRMSALVTRHLAGRCEAATVISGLTLHGSETSTEPGSYLYEPSFAFIIRGSKRVVLGNEAIVYDEEHFLLTAVGLPTIVQVIDATPNHPYVAIKWDIDLMMARDLITEVDLYAPISNSRSAGMSIGPVTPALTSAAMRLIELLDAPEDIPILAETILRELLYRVLTSQIGARLRQVVQTGSQVNKIATAIRFIRDHFDRPIHLSELAQSVAMAESTLYHNFRTLTAMSPLQYQKRLRLHAARRMMLNDGVRAGSAAYRVGYESATQFNREYRRLFGIPPRQDIQRIQAGYGIQVELGKKQDGTN